MPKRVEVKLYQQMYAAAEHLARDQHRSINELCAFALRALLRQHRYKLPSIEEMRENERAGTRVVYVPGSKPPKPMQTSALGVEAKTGGGS